MLRLTPLELSFGSCAGIVEADPVHWKRLLTILYRTCYTAFLDVILPNDCGPKLVRDLTYPATAKKKVDMIFTDLAGIVVTPEVTVLREIFPGLTPDDIQPVTEPTLIVSPDLREMEL